jgi:uncharacterized protein YukE
MNQQRRALELAQKVMQSWQGQAPVGFNEAFQAVNQALEQPADHVRDATKMVRPQNCGTGYCSCIECPFKKGGA